MVDRTCARRREPTRQRSVSPTVTSLLGVLVALFVISGATPAGQPASLEVVAAGFVDPVSVAVDVSGTIVVSDRIAGTIEQIAPDGSRSVLVGGLQRPAGLAFDSAGGLLIAEQGNGRVLRRDPSGVLAVVAGGINGPRWIAVAPDGTLYVSAKGLAGGSSGGGSSRLRRVLRVTPAGVVSVFAESFSGLQGLAVQDGAVVAAIKRLPGETGSAYARLVRIPILGDGSAASPQVLVRGGVYVPSGVATDSLGALLLTARAGEDGDDDRDSGDDEDVDDDDDNDDGDPEAADGSGVVLKRLASGTVATLAAGLREPRGLVMEPAGHLLIVEGKADRLVRLRAPIAPLVTAPPFTNQRPVTLSGSAEPGSLVQVFRDAVNTSPLASALADGATGAFTMSVPLTANTQNVLLFTATSAGGVGLTSPAASRTIVHDDRPPVTAILEPPANAHVNGALAVSARGEDDGSGVARLAVAVDGEPRGETANPDPAQPLVASFAVDTAGLTEGPHVLEAASHDRASNSSAAAQPFTVDRTPPDTQIVGGPGAETAETTATFTVTGTDAIASSDALTFTWRLDDGPWSAFGSETVITVSGLTAGLHRFEVKARDLAGNEDPTPAVGSFSVTALRILILEPVEGAAVSAPSVLVRGTIEGGGSDVSVMLTLELQGQSSFTQVPVVVEAGTFALQLPVRPSTTTLTFTATDAEGATATASVTILVQAPTSRYERLGVSPPVGFAPHTVQFGILQSAGSTLQLDLDSNGSVDFSGSALTGQRFTYQHPGVYLATLRQTTPEGIVFTHQSIVEVYDRPALDARLQAIWRNFIEALTTGNVGDALTMIHSDRRPGWQAALGQLGPEQLATASTVFTTIELVEIRPGVALCDMRREDDGVMYSFPIEFALDSDGRWRLWQF